MKRPAMPKRSKRSQQKQYLAAVRIGKEQEVFVFDKKRKRDRFLKDIESFEGVEWAKAESDALVH